MMNVVRFLKKEIAEWKEAFNEVRSEIREWREIRMMMKGHEEKEMMRWREDYEVMKGYEVRDEMRRGFEGVGEMEKENKEVRGVEMERGCDGKTERMMISVEGGEFMRWGVDEVFKKS